MHIIKISPAGFKIILSKDDLQKYWVGNIFENTDASGAFFEEIIERTNTLYGNPFIEGAIDAEFFESKDGGGELFLCSSKNQIKSTVYQFTTRDSDNLFMLCSRLNRLSEHEKSTLFLQDGLYCLIIFCPRRKNNLVSIIKEYGSCNEAGKLVLWQLEEHAKLLCRDTAIETLSAFT